MVFIEGNIHFLSFGELSVSSMKTQWASHFINTGETLELCSGMMATLTLGASIPAIFVAAITAAAALFTKLN